MQSLLKILFFLITLILVGCAPLVKNEQPTHPDFVELNKDNSLGQTVLARFDGLQGIAVYLKSEGDNSSEIHLQLYDNPIDREILRSTSISFADVSSPGFYDFTFPALISSTSEDYYFSLSVEGPGSVRVGSAPGNAYLNGSSYKSVLAQNSQLTFKLEYELSEVLIGIFKQVFRWLSFLASGLFLIVTPGLAALICLFPPLKSMNWGEKIGLSAGVGIALYAVLFLWLNTVGLKIGILFVWVIPLIGLILIIAKKIQSNRDQLLNKKEVHLHPNTVPVKKKDHDNKKPPWRLLNINFPDLALIIVMGFVILTRFWPIRTFDAPMWGDSYQHTMISKLLIDNGGLFRSWQPYAELTTFTYHFGFHAIVSIYHWFTGMDVIQATLWIGQFINVLAIFALYPLALFIGKNRWAGVIAVLIAGMLSPMPMHYVNWGRYTQLAGQVILPVVTVIIWSNLESNINNWKWNGLIWLVLAGLSLTHYRVLIFIPLFYIAFLLLNIRELNIQRFLGRILLHASGTIILILPWVARVFEGQFLDIFGRQLLTPAAQISQAVQESNRIGNISFYLPIFLWILMLISVAWGIWQRNRRSNIISLWTLLILFAANPNWLRLPGTGLLTNFAIFIAAYIPASVLIGSATGSFLTQLGVGTKDGLLDNSMPYLANKKQRQLMWTFIWPAILVIFIVVSSIWFLRARLSDVQPASHAMVTRPDARAAEWIDDNLPIEAKFLVNSFFAYGNSLVVGADAGWWLPLLTNRENSQPPINYATEEGPIPGYREWVNELVASIQMWGISDQNTLQLLQQRDITHIYIGQQQGRVNTPSPLLDPQDLLESPIYTPIYHQDRVWIFSVLQ